MIVLKILGGMAVVSGVLSLAMYRSLKDLFDKDE